MFHVNMLKPYHDKDNLVQRRGKGGNNIDGLGEAAQLVK